MTILLSRRKLTILCDIVQITIVLTLLLFDAVIFGLTVRKTYRHVKEMRRLRQLSIGQVVLRDGQCRPIIMFGVIMLSTISISYLSLCILCRRDVLPASDS